MTSPATRFLIQAWNSILGGEENIRSIANALKTMTPEHVASHAGTLFTHRDKHTVAASDSFNVYVVPNSGTSLNLLPFEFKADAGPGDIYLYESPYTNPASLGTDISSNFKNHNRVSANVAPFSAYENVYFNPASAGQQIDYGLMEQTGGGPIKNAGGEAGGGDNEWQLDPAKGYLVRYTNNSAGQATVLSGLAVYEEG